MLVGYAGVWLEMFFAWYIVIHYRVEYLTWLQSIQKPHPLRVVGTSATATVTFKNQDSRRPISMEVAAAQIWKVVKVCENHFPNHSPQLAIWVLDGSCQFGSNHVSKFLFFTRFGFGMGVFLEFWGSPVRDCLKKEVSPNIISYISTEFRNHFWFIIPNWPDFLFERTPTSF